MDTKILKDMINVIRIEQGRRISQLRDEDPDLVSDQWLFTDGPFLNELCLTFLVTLSHQVEKELIKVMAQVVDGREEISGEQYQENIKQWRKGKKGWEKIKDRLKLESYEEYTFIEALRLLANSYKHEPSMKPDDRLLKLLKLETGVNYAPLPESEALRGGFAKFIGIKGNADYCDIAERFVEKSEDFISNVKSHINLSKVKLGPVSLKPNDFER